MQRSKFFIFLSWLPYIPTHSQKSAFDNKASEIKQIFVQFSLHYGKVTFNSGTKTGVYYRTITAAKSK